jgi:rhodanese-related sulfurtransferase
MTWLQKIAKWWRSVSGADTRMTAAELQQALTAKTPLYILDVRSAQEYKNDGHIVGAHLIPLGDLAEKLKQVPTDRTVVCVCRSGARSSAALAQLQRAGYTNVRNLAGGMMGWQASGLPTKRK